MVEVEVPGGHNAAHSDPGASQGQERCKGAKDSTHDGFWASIPVGFHLPGGGRFLREAPRRAEKCKTNEIGNQRGSENQWPNSHKQEP